MTLTRSDLDLFWKTISEFKNSHWFGESSPPPTLSKRLINI